MLAPLLAALTVISTHTWIRQGPVLSDSRVVWASAAPAVYASPPFRRLWRARGVGITELAASASRIAFIQRGDVLVGPPFQRLAPARSVDVDGTTVAYAQTVRGTSRIVVGGVTVATSREFEYTHVAVAGRYAAWIERTGLERWPAPPSSVVVYDLAARRIVYVLDVDELGHTVVSSLDLDADGTVAFASDPAPAGGCDGGVAWASVAQPRPHYLAGDAIPWHLKIGSGRIAYLTRTCVAPTPFRLVVKTLADRTLADGVVAYGGFDFDGRRLVHLQSAKTIAVERLG